MRVVCTIARQASPARRRTSHKRHWDVRSASVDEWWRTRIPSHSGQCASDSVLIHVCSAVRFLADCVARHGITDAKAADVER
jgi:hypothetical protein